MSSTAIYIADMHCAACVAKIESQLNSLPFVEKIHINPVRRQVHVEHRAGGGDFELLQCIEALGFKPTLKRQSEIDSGQRKSHIKRLGIAGICMMQIMMASIAIYSGDYWGMDALSRQLLSWASLIFALPIVGYCAQPFYRSAWASLRTGINMDVPVALAITLAFSVSLVNTVTNQGPVYFDSVAMFTFLMLGARLVDASLKRRISVDDETFAAAPIQVQRLTSAGSETCRLQDISIGDTLLITEGQVLPVDATLLDSTALFDEASLSGESQWVQKRPGDTLYAGTYNRGALLRCQVAALPAESRAAQIQSLADRIVLSKAPLARLADKIARWFVPAIIAIALVTYVGRTLLGLDGAFSAALAVLIVSCPCALALAVPCALSAAMARLRRQGILLTDSAVLEQTVHITQLYVDKTGTLTLPQLNLLSTRATGQLSKDQCLAIAHTLQSYSSHPIARAFTQLEIAPHLLDAYAISQVETVAGQGVKGQLATEELRLGSAEFCQLGLPSKPNCVYLTLAGQQLACFQLGISLRADTEQAVQRLRQQNLDITMLSGDHKDNCRELATRLNIAFISDQLPEAKRATIQARRKPSDRVMFVGDGINDALAFSEADVAVCTLETSDMVRARASAALLTQRLGAVADLFAVSHASRRIVLQNLAWAALYNCIAIPSAMAGLMPPWLAAIGMATSSVLVMLNATRLLNYRTVSPTPNHTSLEPG